MQVTKLICPTCAAKIQIGRQLPQGAKGKCPRCQTTDQWDESGADLCLRSSGLEWRSMDVPKRPNQLSQETAAEAVRQTSLGPWSENMPANLQVRQWVAECAALCEPVHVEWLSG